VALSLAAAIADGLPWCSRRVTPGSVAFLSFEGDALAQRLRALHHVQHHRLDHLYVLRATDPLSPQVTRDGRELPAVGELVAAAALADLDALLRDHHRPPLRLVVIDTVRASLAGSEDDSGATAAYLRAVRRLVAAVPEAAVLLTHHAGWQDGDQRRRRERGSSAWRGNVDGTLYLDAGPTTATGDVPITLRTLKTRDEAGAGSLALLRRTVPLPDARDAEGRPCTSCVVEPDPGPPEAGTRAPAMTDTAADLERRILHAVATYPAGFTSADGLRQHLRCRKHDLTAALGRLLARGSLRDGRRGQAYQLTANAQHELQEVPS